MAGRPEEALRSYQEGLKVVREIGDNSFLAEHQSNVGFINAMLGRYVEAFFSQQDALAKRREIGDKREILRSLIGIGSVEQVQGRYEEALKYYLEGLALAREIGSKDGNIVLSANLSNVHEDQGDYRSGLALIGEAEIEAREIGDQRLLATCLAYLGITRLRAGDLPGAETALAESVALSEEMNSPALLAEALIYQAELLRAQGQPDRAANVSKQALEAAARAKVYRLGLMAEMQAAESARSVPRLVKAIEDADSSGLAPLVTRGRLILARVHLDAGRAGDAVDEAERAIDSGTPLRERDLLFQAHALAGSVQESRGKRREAYDHHAAALGLLEEMRRGLGDPHLGHLLARPETTSFAERAAELFQGMDRSAELERLRTAMQP